MSTLSRILAALAVIACGAESTSPLPLDHLELRHNTRLAYVGGRIKIEVVGFSDNSVPLSSTPTVEWTSDDASIATVDQNGWVTGLGVGEVPIRATSGSVQASLRIRVRPASLGIVTFGSPDLVIGESVILRAEFRDVHDRKIPGPALRYDWVTGDTTVVRLTPMPGVNDAQVSVTALSTGLASLSVGTQELMRRYVIGVVPESPPSDAPLRISDFYFSTVWEDVFAYVPTMQVVIAPGRRVDVIRVEATVPSQFPKQLPALCATRSLNAGTHALLGPESYPYSSFHHYGYYPKDNSDGVALLTYRTEGGKEVSLLARGAVDDWTYGYGPSTSFPWSVCQS